MEYFKTVSNDFTVINPDTPVTENEAKHMLQFVQSALTDSKKVAILTNVTEYQSEEVNLVFAHAGQVATGLKTKAITTIGLDDSIDLDSVNVEILHTDVVYALDQPFPPREPKYTVEWRDGGVMSGSQPFDSIEEAKAEILKRANQSSSRELFASGNTKICIVPSSDLSEVVFHLNFELHVKAEITYPKTTTQYLVA